MSRKHVLIISNPEDIHTQEVVDRIKGYGAEPFLFYPESLGHTNSLSLSLNNISDAKIGLQIGTYQISINDIYSVWYRRPRIPSLVQYNLQNEALEFSRDEWRGFLHGIYSLLQKQLWVSHPHKLHLASSKPLQLQIAKELGFKIPRTLITNEKIKAREFISKFESVIVKPTGSGWIYNEDNDVAYILTNRVTDKSMEMLDDIQIAPVTFQEEIFKAYELRVNVVGKKVLAIKIDSQKSTISQVDWRRYDVKNTPYSNYQLPENIAVKCLLLTQRLGLQFGAIDLIRSVEGDYIFLEINGNGQFLWAEKLSEVQVGDAIASLLSGVSPPLESI